MNKLVGVQIREEGRVQVFDSGHFVLKKGDRVIVDTEQGPAFGVVSEEPKRCCQDMTDKSLNKILRLANDKDRERYWKNSRLETDVHTFCYERIKARSIPMNLVGVERLFDGSKVMIYFTADGRVDFRELVKDLVQKFHTRIEMRQIGVRHQAKMVGGLGSCGRQLCCTSFLNSFEPVSIKMAKEQNLSLSPSKISGMCGRLMCCLTYEFKFYENVKKNLPKIGKRVETKSGEGKVVRQNVFKGTLTLILDSGEEIEVTYEDIVRGRPKNN